MIGLTFPVYVTSKKHFEILCDFFASVKSSEKLFKLAVINVISLEFYQKTIDVLKNNGCTIIQNAYGNSVSGAWNSGILECFHAGCEFVIVPNTDVIFKDSCIDNLVKFWSDNKTKYGIWCARPLASMDELNRATIEDVTVETGLYSMFAVSRTNIRKLSLLEAEGSELYPGLFDTNFTPAYFEDNDYDRRLYLANMKPATTHSAAYWHLGSQTIRNDKELEVNIGPSFEKNRKYFNIKWRTIVKGKPDPFNDGGFAGAFGNAGHLIGNYANTVKNTAPDVVEAVRKRITESPEDTVDCTDYTVEQSFLALFYALETNNKTLILNKELEQHGALNCAVKEYELVRGVA